MLFIILTYVILILIIIGMYTWFKIWKKDNFEKYCKNNYQQLEEEYRQKLEEHFNQSKLYYAEELAEIDKKIAEEKELYENLLKNREEKIFKQIEKKREEQEEKLSKEIEETERYIREWSKSAQEAAQFMHNSFLKEYEQDKAIKQKELNELSEKIEEYKQKQVTINKEISRRKELEEKETFYRIHIPDSYKQDLEVFKSIKQKISKIDIFDKLIYDNYIKKNVDEMTKRILNRNKEVCGIYKITRLKTGEIYIGKSTNIDARWKEHCKSCYHCGSISHSNLHTIMEKDGIENFTWEVLEEVPKDKLTEREKYWINFFDSKKYGLNERIG